MKIIIALLFALVLQTEVVANEQMNYPLDPEINYPLEEAPIFSDEK